MLLSHERISPYPGRRLGRNVHCSQVGAIDSSRLHAGRCEGSLVLEQLNGQGDAAMLTDDVLQRMYDLAHCLHPDNGVALSVTLEACDRIAILRRMQDRRGGHYKFRLPEACLPQYCVYLASESREREQERRCPGKEPRYRP